MNKVSQPLLDRFDIVIQAEPVTYDEITATNNGSSSYDMRLRVMNAYHIQRKRYEGKKILFNSQLSSHDILEFCQLDQDLNEILKDAFYQYEFSARSMDRIKKVARTIADLDGSEMILKNHLVEAITYKSIDVRKVGALYG